MKRNHFGAGDRRRAAAPAAALLWAALFFLCGQVALVLFLERVPRMVRDPEYGLRLAYLRQEQARKPGRPLVVILGNSRSALGLRPDYMTTGLAGDGADPVVFNFSLFGAGPVMELLCLNRLLADGIRPDWVLVEYWPPVLNQQATQTEEQRIDPNRIAWGDLPLLLRYWRDPDALRRRYAEGRLEALFTYRFALVSKVCPAWLPWSARRDYAWDKITSLGWFPNPHDASPNPEEHRRRLDEVAKFYRPWLTNYEISDVSDRAMRELLARCQREGIRVALLVMPEGSPFRALYPPAAEAKADAYLSLLAREYGVPVANCRDWAADGDFTDSFHLGIDAAAAFSRRFGDEVLGPLLSSRFTLTQAAGGGRRP
jgi:hypothetical protein